MSKVEIIDVKKITVNVYDCSRCGDNHFKLEFKGLTTPIEDYQWFAMCPKLNEVLLMKIN